MCGGMGVKCVRAGGVALPCDTQRIQAGPQI